MHLAVSFDALEDVRRRVVVALAVADRYPQNLAGPRAARERRVVPLDANVHVLTPVLQPAVPQHRARKQSGFEQNLKPVADADHEPAALGERLDLAHDRREARHRAGAKVVAVSEPAGQHDDVGALQAGVLVPDELGRLAEHGRRRMIRIVVAVAAGKHDDAEFHVRSSLSASRRPAPGAQALAAEIDNRSALIDFDAIALDHRIRRAACRRPRPPVPLAWAASVVARSSSKYLPCLTSATPA